MENFNPTDENAQILERRQKLAALRAEKNSAFPNDFAPRHTAGQIHTQLDSKSKEELEQETHLFSVAGRILLKRIMGKASFITIQDRSGQIQIYLRQNEIANYEDFKHFDLGDIEIGRAHV